MTEIQEISIKIHEIRGVKVMLADDLATLYKVQTKNLNLAVKRNNTLFQTISCFSRLKKNMKT